jgi:hypothetical protein
MGSIHVPATVVQRITRILAWAMPSASVVFSGLALGWRWVGDRASVADVSAQIAPAIVAAKAAQADAFHCSSLLDAHQRALVRAWGEIVEIRAELEVYRRYASRPQKGDLIEEARRWYRAQYDDEVEHRPTDPSEAARRALQACWRCGR